MYTPLSTEAYKHSNIKDQKVVSLYIRIKTEESHSRGTTIFRLIYLKTDFYISFLKNEKCYG